MKADYKNWVRCLCTKIKNWYLQMIQGYGWLTGSKWRILLFLFVCFCFIMFSAWHTERAICYIFGIQQTFGCTYFLFVLCGLALLMHEADHPWQHEWLMVPVGLLSVFMLYYCVLSPVWLLIVGVFGFSIVVDSYGTISILICTCLIVLIGFWNTKTIRIVSRSLPMQGIHKPYRIVLISDIHLGPFIGFKHIRRVVNSINEICPDIVIIAGDLIDNDCSLPQHDPDMSRVAHQLRKIQSPGGTILTLGNHDPAVSNKYFLSFLQESNIKILNNEVAEFSEFYIVGRTDPSKNSREPIANLMRKCTKQKPRIIVDHDPQYIDEAVSCGADLVLSGHTHAGQFFPASTAVRFALGKEKFYGHHIVGKTHCIISAGVGVFNLPVRIGTRNEIVDITLEPERNDHHGKKNANTGCPVVGRESVGNMSVNEKYAKKYANMFRRTMKEIGRKDADKLYAVFYTRYLAHLNSQEFAEFSRYKTISLEKVYCAITHAQICLELGYSLDEAQHIWEKILCRNFKKFFNGAMAFLDALPNGYRIVAGWLYKDAKERIAENCLTYELLEYTGQKLEYKISRCAYVEIFEHYGIRQFCKVFCNNDLCMAVMKRHAKFIRHSDLVDGPYCHDEIIKR